VSILEIFQWVQWTRFATALRESELAYPLVMTGHLTGMGLFGGMIAMTDLRLLGWAMTGMSITDVVEQFRPWKRIGFVLVVGCGLSLLAAKAEFYYHNPFYWTKMTLLALVGVHAIVFHRSVYGNTKALDSAPKIPRIAKIAACISLLLWLGLVAAGRSIAYFDVPDNLRQNYQDRAGALRHTSMAMTMLAASVAAPTATCAVVAAMK
jgi:peptidoglycan/LPS O-acetylase OafA/YrhL